jgi:hypothetical protein
MVIDLAGGGAFAAIDVDGLVGHLRHRREPALLERVNERAGFLQRPLRGPEAQPGVLDQAPHVGVGVLAIAASDRAIDAHAGDVLGQLVVARAQRDFLTAHANARFGDPDRVADIVARLLEIKQRDSDFLAVGEHDLPALADVEIDGAQDGRPRRDRRLGLSVGDHEQQEQRHRAAHGEHLLPISRVLCRDRARPDAMTISRRDDRLPAQVHRTTGCRRFARTTPLW